MNDFGGKLRQARERRGVSLRQIAASTKISVAALEALERNDISRLPGGIFSRAFVRSYATEIGLDPDETVREFLERFHGEAPPASAHPTAASHHPPHAPRETPARHMPLGEEESKFESQQRMAGVLLKLLLLSVPLAGIILYLTLWRAPAAAPQGADDTGTPAARPDSHPPSTASEPTEAPRRQPPAQPAPSTTQGARPTAPAVLTPPAAAPAVVPADQPLVLELHPTGPCWISLTVDGEMVMSRIMQPGEKDVRRIRDTAVIEVGDAGAFAFTVNGRPGRSLGESGQVKTAKISRSTLAQYVR